MMQYFMDTVETIEPGLGFSHFDGTHLIWLAVFLAAVAGNTIWYRKLGESGRNHWRKTVALLLIADEVFKMAMLLIGGRFLPSYLPLHLCSINIFVIAVHAWKPSKLLSNFLYTICIPGTMAALLFPSWTELPVLNFMHLHSFTVHILLALYPIVLGLNGELKPTVKELPKCVILLAGMAMVALVCDLIFEDANFMFLMYADPGNPLYIFEQLWGSHLWGFLVLVPAVLFVMYFPVELYRYAKKKKHSA